MLRESEGGRAVEKEVDRFSLDFASLRRSVNAKIQEKREREEKENMGIFQHHQVDSDMEEVD